MKWRILQKRPGRFYIQKSRFGILWTDIDWECSLSSAKRILATKMGDYQAIQEAKKFKSKVVYRPEDDNEGGV